MKKWKISSREEICIFSIEEKSEIDWRESFVEIKSTLFCDNGVIDLRASKSNRR